MVKIIPRNKDLKLTLNLPTGRKITVTESGGADAVTEEYATTSKENPATGNRRPIRNRQKPDRLQIQPKEKSYD